MAWQGCAASVIYGEVYVLFGQGVDELAGDGDAAVGAQVERAVDRGVEDAECQFAVGIGFALDFLLDQLFDVFGYLVGGQVDCDRVYELAFHIVEQTDIHDVEAQRRRGEALLIASGDEDWRARDSVVVEVDIGLFKEHELGAAGVVLDFEYAELAAVAGRTAGEVDHHASERKFHAFDRIEFIVALDGACAVGQLHEIRIEGMCREIHTDKFAFAFKLHCRGPFLLRNYGGTTCGAHLRVVAEERHGRVVLVVLECLSVADEGFCKHFATRVFIEEILALHPFETVECAGIDEILKDAAVDSRRGDTLYEIIDRLKRAVLDRKSVV